MKRLFIFLLLGMFLISFTSAFGLPPKQEITITTIRPTIITYERHIDYYSEELSLLEIEQLSEENTWNKEYKLHVYDCTQFSESLVKTLKSKGYKAQCTAGNNWAFDYTNHTWVSVWVGENRFEIESTTGEILNKEQYSTYEVEWENKCW